jgi:hypothetical protein
MARGWSATDWAAGWKRVGGDCHDHDAQRGGGEQTWRTAAEPEAEAVREAEAAIEEGEVESRLEIGIEIEIEHQGQRWAKTWWIERWRKGG